MSSVDYVLVPLRCLFKLVLIAVQLAAVVWFLHAAYDIRLHPVKEFGYIIHEFDPWFNYRATEYLAEHGLSKFFKWFDYMSWYPLGRPVGTTIYPGMQMTAVAIWETMKLIPNFTHTLNPTLVYVMRRVFKAIRYFGFMKVPTMMKTYTYEQMSVNDICCMMPAWFGSLAALFAGLLAYEVSRSVNAGVITLGIMAIIPAGMMRSMTGEFDNECVAMTCISMTFWLWLRSVRTPSSWPIGLLAGLSYAYMVAVWGGYIFVINMIGLHALMLVGLGRFNSGVHKAYTIFFVVGTALAIQIPVVGLQPLRSLEQMGPLLVFVGYQMLAFCDYQRRSRNMGVKEFVIYRGRVLGCLVAGLVVLTIVLWPTGYFGPLSSRIRGLFVKHTKTGNPLVDSVAEHQPASSGMYQSYLNLPLDYSLLGCLVCMWRRNNGSYFVFLYGFIATHFAGKMSRLVLICAPIVSVTCGIWCGFLLDFLMEPFFLLLGKKGRVDCDDQISAKSNGNDHAKENQEKKPNSSKTKKNGTTKETNEKKPSSSKTKQQKTELAEWEEEERLGGAAHIKRELKAAMKNMLPEIASESGSQMRKLADAKFGSAARAGLSVVLVFFLWNFSDVPMKTKTFVSHCDMVANSLSNPQVVFHSRGRDGSTIVVDDYLKGYQWIDKNTPKDARVMAWWDYGYQITGIAKRTSIADGNTWNHEHIATLGRMLTSPEKKAWNAIRHLADYVLVWAGGQGDDLGKSPHLARIGNSVFPDHCGDDDPKCNKFGFNGALDKPTQMMANSLLYKLVANKVHPGVTVNSKLFKEVHTTERGLMRVYKVMNISEESRDWVADPNNRECDAPGSWYCVGKYPPALEKLISKRRNFAQVEDFNVKGGKSAYTKMIENEL